MTVVMGKPSLRGFLGALYRFLFPPKRPIEPGDVFVVTGPICAKLVA